MFVKIIRSGPRRYLQIVEAYRDPESGHPRQRHIANLAGEKLLGPGGVRAFITENFLLKQQLTVLRRPRQRAPNLTVLDRFLFGFGSLLLSSGRIHEVTIGLQPSPHMKCHNALVRRKNCRLFSSSQRPREPGPKRPSAELIPVIVELKPPNPGFGFPRVALIISQTFGVEIDENVVYRVLLKHYPAPPRGAGPSSLSFIGDTKDGPSFEFQRETAKFAEIKDLRSMSHCRDLVQFPMAA